LNRIKNGRIRGLFFEPPAGGLRGGKPFTWFPPWTPFPCGPPSGCGNRSAPPPKGAVNGQNWGKGRDRASEMRFIATARAKRRKRGPRGSGAWAPWSCRRQWRSPNHLRSKCV